MSVQEREVTLEHFGSYGMIQELWERGDLGLAAREFNRRTRRAPWKRLRLGPSVWGLSSRWFAVCPRSGSEAWITLPFFYFSAGTKNIEWRIGSSKYGMSFDIRWRWD